MSRKERQSRKKSFLMRWRNAIRGSDLKSWARLVALTLSTRMNTQGGSCYPSVTTIARDTGLGRSTVLRALAVLEKEKFLEVVVRGGSERGEKREVNHYEARIPATGVTTVPVSERDWYQQSKRLVSEKSATGVTAGPKDVDLEDVHEDDSGEAAKTQPEDPNERVARHAEKNREIRRMHTEPRTSNGQRSGDLESCASVLPKVIHPLQQPQHLETTDSDDGGRG